MGRTIPRAYVTANWIKNTTHAEKEARAYCRELVNAGYLPLCPVLAFSGVISDLDPDGEQKKRLMSEDLLRRARFFCNILKLFQKEREDVIYEKISSHIDCDHSVCESVICRVCR